MKYDLGHWKCNDSIPDNAYGFVYEIKNKINNKKYIGQKHFYDRIKRPPKKGLKNKRLILKESNWREYTSSSDKVVEDIKKYGKDNFEFNIIKFCFSKSELTYYETKLQFDNDVLLKEEYYNGIINCRLGKIKNNEKL